MANPGEWIGAYRLVRRLGAGGMGEVFLGWDQRLQRTVALKRLLPGRETARARERLLREARAVARLNHTHVVQIYDLIEEPADAAAASEGGAGDWLVLEYVDGVRVADLLGDGPLAAGTAVHLAAQVAAGLAAAHERGLIHRDLKSENVLVTRHGQAKILDFGIARFVEPGAAASLTAEGAVVGTWRAMSPEQAESAGVDARSDLFSFGVLLYEMLAGRPPFSGDSPLALVRSITSEPPPPLAVPGLPEPLLRLVARLLEKDPAARPEGAAEVVRELAGIVPLVGEPAFDGPAFRAAATATADSALAMAETSPEPASPKPRSRAEPPASSETRRFLPVRPRSLVLVGLPVLLLICGFFAWFFRAALFAPAEPLRVAVLEPAGGGAAGELAVPGVLTAALSGLAALQGVTPIDPAQIGEVRGSAVAVARAVAADESLVMAFEAGGDLSLKRVGADGAVLWAETLSLPRALEEGPVQANAVAAALRRGYPDHRPRPGVPDVEARPEDYTELLRIKRRLAAGGGAWGPELPRLAALLETSPRFLDAALETATVALQLYEDSERPEHLRSAEAALARARSLLADDPRVLAIEVRVASLRGDWPRAERGIERLSEVSPGDVLVLFQRARLAESRGRLDEAIGLLREAVARRPAWRYLLRLADLEVRRGDVSAARGHLEELLGRVPGHTWALAKLGVLELVYGDLKRAERLFAELVASGPQRSDLNNLGLVRYLLGDFAGAVDAYRRALALEPGHWAVELNLADALLAQGQEEEARTLYARVLATLTAHAETAPLTPIEQTVTAQCLVHLGNRREAVAKALEAVQASPEEAEVAYQAALVLAVAGETSSALALGKKSLALGMGPRWFSIPAFAGLKAADPELAQMVAKKGRPASGP